jgi:hypothetical protein
MRVSRNRRRTRALAVDDRKAEAVGARLGVESQQQSQTGGVHERQLTQVERDRREPTRTQLLDLRLELRGGDQVELPVGNDAHSFALSPHFDAKRWR